MQEEEYTFVTLDGDDSVFSDAVVVDVDGEKIYLMSWLSTMIVWMFQILLHYLMIL